MLSNNLYETPLSDVFNRVKDVLSKSRYDYDKHNIVLLDEAENNLGHIRLPLHVQIEGDMMVSDRTTVVLYLSIESGNAALCLMDDQLNVYHTTFSAYMTRKKQGVSQIKYLNKKGKSRAGSRVRLAKTIAFFEDINTKLSLLFEQYKIDRIAINCNATLMPYLYNSKVPCPFDKKDDRLYKIPLHIQQSNFTHLEKTIKKLKAPILFYQETNAQQIKELLHEGW